MKKSVKMENIRELTVLQYQQETGINKDKILYQIKKGELKAEKRKFGKQEKWIIKTVVKPTEKTLFSNDKPMEELKELESLRLEVAEIRGELKGKNELITEFKKSQEQQTEHINTLKLTCNLLERENGRLLQIKAPQQEQSEQIIIKQNSKAQNFQEPQEKNPQELKIDLSKMLLDRGLEIKNRKKIKARFNKQLGKRGISKNEKGNIFISSSENYEDLLKI